MAGVVHIPFYATVFRGDKLEAALAELAPLTLRYGASAYAVHRNRDDRYKILFQATFDDKLAWDRFWDGPEFRHFRTANSSYYQVPLIYTWNDVTVEGYLAPERERAGLTPGPGELGDVA
jgi:quinol monooxygenase YgiN